MPVNWHPRFFISVKIAVVSVVVTENFWGSLKAIKTFMRKSPRQRRLEADYRGVCTLQDESTIFSFQCSGDPPQKYRLIFKGQGIFRSPSGEIKVSDHHECLIEFGAAYPRLVPNLAWQTPIYHPNISNNGVVCLGGYGTNWVPSLTLSELSVMLWDMIRYKNFDTESPYNKEAALWAKQQNQNAFPLDRRSIRDKISDPVSNATSGAEIIETGIEIISPDKPSSLEDDGIMFLE